MKKITLLLFSFLALTLNAQTTIWEDGFEAYTDFEIASIGGWTQIDLDGDSTYGSTTYDFTNENYTGTAIIFNPSLTTPASTGTEWDVRTGFKGLYFFASTGSVSGTPLNNDYFISPAIDLTDYASSNLTFWAQSVTDAFGLERFEVLLSTTGTAVGDFTVDLGGGELQAPITYMEYSYDLTAYDGQTIYIAIHYVAQDSFVLQMDDFLVQGTFLSIEEFQLNQIMHSFNQDSKILTLESQKVLKSISVFNILGQETLRTSLNNTHSEIDLSSLQAGIYIAKITGHNNATKTIKLVVK